MEARAALKNLAAWQAADDEDRVTVLVGLATSLGAGWRAGRTSVGRLGLGELLRRDLGLGFVVVPGGWLRMGMSADDVFTAARARRDGTPQALWSTAVNAARPTRWVRMRPYLLAITGLPPAEGKPATDGAAEPAMLTVALDELKDIVPDGFRLPSEAELEWALRDGGQARWAGLPGDADVTAETREAMLRASAYNGFGLQGVRGLQNPCADGAVDYDVEWPIDQHARSTDRGEWVARGAPAGWKEGDADVIASLAAHRAAAKADALTIVRLAMDLPGVTGDDEADAKAADAKAADAKPAGAKPADAKPAGEPAADAKAADAKAADEPAADAKAAAQAPPTPKAPADEGPPGPLAEHALALAALTGTDARRQLDALTALAHLAIGPGHDVGATAAAVIEGLATMTPAIRARALTWLADVQVAGHARLATERPERKRRHELSEDRAAVRAAVAGATDAIVACLDDADADVRGAAALALAFTVDAPAEAKSALGRRLGRESELGVQAMLILACVRLGTGFRAPAPDPVIAGAIAIATAFDGPPNNAALIEATQLGPTPHLPFGGGDLGRVAIGILRKGDAEVQAEAAAAIAGRALAEQNAELALVACEMVFGAPSATAVPRLLEELSSGQRQVVRGLADLERALDWAGYGLPPTVTARRRFLALDPDGPTDRFVSHGELEVPLWFALRTRQATGGLPAAQAEAARLLASLPIGERIAIFLDRDAHQLAEIFAQTSLDAIIAADRAAARAAIDELLAAPAAGPRGPELVRAFAATRPGEELPETLLREIDGRALGHDLDALRGFTPAAIARHLNATLQPVLDRCLASDDAQAGIDADLQRWARVLKIAPSPSATKRLLLLGWASGQPAAVRAAVGASATGHASLEAVLAEYDGVAKFSGWPGARAALATYRG